MIKRRKKKKVNRKENNLKKAKILKRRLQSHPYTLSELIHEVIETGDITRGRGLARAEEGGSASIKLRVMVEILEFNYAF